jgi:hypothetical protein
MSGHMKWADLRDGQRLHQELKGYTRKQANDMVLLARKMPGTLVCGDAEHGKVGVMVVSEDGELAQIALAS